MSHVPHELTEEFPHQTVLIHDLRGRDSHFRKLADDYHRVNRTLHRVESNLEPMDDVHALALRRERMRLKDEIAKHLS